MAAQSDKTRSATGTFTRTAPTLLKSIVVLRLRSNVRPLGGASCDSVLCSVFLLVFLCAVQSIQIRSISPGQKWPGFSFALHPTRCRAFILSLYNTAPYKRLQRVLRSQCNLYHTRRKTARRALQGLFLLFVIFCRCCVAGASGYTAPPAPRWSVSQRLDGLHRYQILDAMPDAAQLSTDRIL